MTTGAGTGTGTGTGTAAFPTFFVIPNLGRVKLRAPTPTAKLMSTQISMIIGYASPMLLMGLFWTVDGSEASLG